LTLHRGDIVIISALPDPRGRNPKDRPAVIVTPSDELDLGGAVAVIAITTTLSDPLPDDHVPLRWQRPKHPRTGLNARNAVVCHWLTMVEPDRVERVIGAVNNAELGRIDEILRRLADES
jgi:mRNA-degrading endonuclease toxin of MazEF toxin-antitoxin module